MKRLAGYTTVVMATLALLVILWQFRAALGVFVLSLIAAAAVRPIMARLAARGAPQPAAMLLTYLVGISLFVLLSYLLGGALVDELERLANQVTFAYELTRLAWLEGSDFQQALASRTPPPEELYGSITGRQGELLAQRLFGVTQSLVAALGGLIVVLVLSIYWTADRNHFERLWLSLLPAGQRARARGVWRAIEDGVGAYLRSELIQGFVSFFLLALGYYLLDLPYPLLLALVGAFAWLVPIVGTIFALIPVLLVTLPSSLLLGLVAAAYTLTVLLLLELVVEPRFFNRRRYSSLLIVLTMLVLADAFGVLGLIFAPPLAAAIQIFFTTLYSSRAAPIATHPAAQLATMQARLDRLRSMLLESDRDTPSELENMVARLESLLRKASQAVVGDPKQASGGDTNTA